MEVLGLLISGALAGWLAAKVVRGAGYGLVINVALGIIGGIVGGMLFALFGIPADGWLTSLAMAVVGAVMLLTLIHLLRGRAH